MERMTRQRIYEDLYDYYTECREYKLALFIKKYFFENIKDASQLQQELGFRSERTLRSRKSRISRDLVQLRMISDDQIKVFRSPDRGKRIAKKQGN